MLDEFIQMAKAKRERERLSMTDLARQAGIGRPYLYRVLNGEQTPSFATAEKIAKVLGITLKVSENTA